MATCPACGPNHATVGRLSTQRTAAGVQILAPWAAGQMDTTSRLRPDESAAVHDLPLFTQDEDAEAARVAASQRSIFDAPEE